MFEFGFWLDSYCMQKEIWKPLAYLENCQTMFAVWKGPAAGIMQHRISIVGWFSSSSSWHSSSWNDLIQYVVHTQPFAPSMVPGMQAWHDLVTWPIQKQWKKHMNKLLAANIARQVYVGQHLGMNLVYPLHTATIGEFPALPPSDRPNFVVSKIWSMQRPKNRRAPRLATSKATLHSNFCSSNLHLFEQVHNRSTHSFKTVWTVH